MRLNVHQQGPVDTDGLLSLNGPLVRGSRDYCTVLGPPAWREERISGRQVTYSSSHSAGGWLLMMCGKVHDSPAISLLPA